MQQQTHTQQSSSGPKALNPSPNAPKKKAPMNPKVLIGLGVGAVVLIGAIVTAVIVTRPPKEPPLNADSVDIIRFAGTEQFNDLPFERQYIFMKLIDDREKQLKDRYEEGQIEAPELRLTKELAWFGKQLDRMNKYHAKQNAQQKQAYIDELIRKAEAKDAEDEKSEKEKSATPRNDTKERKSGDVPRDQLTEEIRPLTWPKDVQAKWNAYRTALRDRKEALKPPEAPVTGTK
jgi:hypothetical protein